MDHQKYYDIDKLREAKSLFPEKWATLYGTVEHVHNLSDKIGSPGSVSNLPLDIVKMFDALDALPSALSSLNTAYRECTGTNLLYKIDRFNLKGTQLVLAETMYVDMTNFIHED